MKGIVLAGYSGTKLLPLTLGIPKQLLALYNKPMIYYPIETLIDAGIKDVLIIVNPMYSSAFFNSLGDGSKFNARFTYATQTNPEGIAQAFRIAENYIGNDEVCLITGDCILIGKNRSEKLTKAIRAAKKSGQATIFVCKDYDPDQYGVVLLDSKGRCERVEGNPTPQSYYSITGLYVFPRGVTDYAKVIDKSERGLLEITTLNQTYLTENKLQAQILGSDFRWFDTNSFDSLMIISNYLQQQEKNKK